MTHLPYIIGAYAIAIGIPLLLSIDALMRSRSVRRRLQAIDPRRNRGGL